MMISVTIPTYNDMIVLDQCLQHLNQQVYNSAWEIIVIDDGSTDKTQLLLQQWQNKWCHLTGKFSYFYQTNKKQGVARNYGAKMAKGEIIIFIGADILVQDGWLQQHANFHTKFSNLKQIAVGYMTWSPVLATDRFRQWLESSGLMLNYTGLTNYQLTNFWHFYTGNISMKKYWFNQFQFDESFTTYGFEDIMLGYEMFKNGGEIYYLAEAKAYHHHPLQYADIFPQRMRYIGQSAVLFAKKHPEVKIVPTGIKLIIFKILSWQLIIDTLGKIKLEWQWYALSKKYFLEGINLKRK